jgi:SRSO17 transposase
LARLGLADVVAIRSNHHHHVWTFPGERVRQTRWRPFERVFTDGTSEQRYRCEFVFGKHTRVRYWVITTDPVRLPPETTWNVMTNLPGKIEQTVGNTFGLRTWITDGFKQAKDELGWADYRRTDHGCPQYRALVGTGHVRLSAGAPPGAGIAGMGSASAR